MDAIEVATTYLDSLSSHDAEHARLAPDARRINNGKVSVEGAEALREIIRREPVAEMGTFRWLVDGDQAIVFYDLEADLSRGSGNVLGPRDTWIPAYVGERFQVTEGLIREIEVVYSAAPGRPRPERPVRHPTGRDTRESVLAAARAYLASLVSHDASRVPLAHDVWRIENGRNTADDDASLRKSLESEIMQSIQGIDDASWFAAGDGACVFYTLRVRANDGETFVRVAERFRVVDGLLVEIEAIFAPRPA